jgi:hypothetical protein
MHFTKEEMDILAWLTKSELRVQDMLPERDEELFKRLTELYESFTW